MNIKDKRILLILGLSIIALLITGLMIYLITFNHNFMSLSKEIHKYEKSYSLNDFNKIKINTSNYDIEIKENDVNNIRYEVYSSKENNTKSIISNNTLNIFNEQTTNICIGFCFSSRERIVLYFPKKIKINVDVITSSGDINIGSFENIDITIKTSSGDILANLLDEANIRTHSGDIKIDKLNVINVQTNSGDITLNELSMKDNSNIETNSGDVSIKNIGECFIDAKSSSGDINIKDNNRLSKNELKIKTDSGDIAVE